MFRISFTVRDGSLSSVLKELDGKAYDLEVRPVATKNKTTRRGTGEWLDGLPQTFRFAQAKQIVGAGVSSYLTRALHKKQIKRAGTGQYVKL